MKKINEADSRMLNAGVAMIGITAKQAGNLPNGYRYYAYCSNHKAGFYSNNALQYVLFRNHHLRFN